MDASKLPLSGVKDLQQYRDKSLHHFTDNWLALYAKLRRSGGVGGAGTNLHGMGRQTYQSRLCLESKICNNDISKAYTTLHTTGLHCMRS